ncbi:MAG: ATP-binding cassette domain-containing protein [Eggerthellaceae bacterium]|nr:ATP-binding cassette domain-containing protein [Eggerthellaceae bacterium]
MGLFDEQIRQRKHGDQSLFEDSILRMASAVVGREAAGSLASGRVVTKEAVDDILKFYRINPVDIPADVADPDEQLEYALRPHGIMHRMVALSDRWYKDAFGPMIAYRASDGAPVPVFPKAYRGYWFRDEAGRKVSVNASNARDFAAQARCFYRPLPLGKIGVPDLLRYMKQCLNAADVALLVGITLLVTLTGMLVPPIVKVLTGYVADTGSYAVLWSTAAFLLCAAVSRQLVTASREIAVNRILTKASLSVASAFMMRILSLPATFFRDYSAGELASRSMAAKSLVELIVSNVFSLGTTALFSLLYVTQVGQFAPALMWPAVGIIAATVAVALATTIAQMRVTRRQMQFAAKENGKSFAMIHGVQKIKLAGAEKRAFAQWARSYTRSAELQYNPPLFLKLSSAINTAVTMAGAIWLYYLAATSGVTPSDYIAFFTAYGMVLGAFASLAGVVKASAQIRPYLDMLEPILNAEPEVAEDKEILTGLFGSIELEDVRFRYDESAPYVIDGMDLSIRPGQYVAIVGKSGCGKSTLVRLLLGFEKPEKGAVYYDGKDISGVDLRSLRRRIGVVTQDGSLFAEDIFSNITISAPHLSLDDAWEAAEIAGIADDIRAMPMGMQTMISEGAGGISGGQKQRLMIARAVAPKPRVLIFDEATSALDNKTQKQVSESLDALKCTRIVIAHRLSTIKNCDRILYLDGGRIVEDGSYDELIERGGLFAELVERQRLDR